MESGEEDCADRAEESTLDGFRCRLLPVDASHGRDASTPHSMTDQ